MKRIEEIRSKRQDLHIKNRSVVAVIIDDAEISKSTEPFLLFLQVVGQASMPDDIVARAGKI